MKKLYLFILLAIVLSVNVIAIPTYLKDYPATISHPIRADGSVSSSIVANITIKDPDKITLLGNSKMSYNPLTLEHNITLPANSTSKLGVYEYCISATNGSLSTTECFPFAVNLTGKETSTAQGIIYFFVGLFSLFLFLFCMYLSIKLPSKNVRSTKTNFIVGMNDLKYVRYVAMYFCYLFFLMLIFSVFYIAQITNLDFVAKIFYFVFILFSLILVPASIILLLKVVYTYLADGKIRKMLEMGLNVR